MKSNMNDVSEVELNFMDFQRIGESIERLLRCGFEIFDNADGLVKRRLVDQAARSIDEQTNVFLKLNFKRKLHFVYSIDLHSCHSVSLDGLATEGPAQLGHALQGFEIHVDQPEAVAEPRRSTRSCPSRAIA
jgi:hypothetical protein